MKTILTIILAFMMLGCGSDNMAHIGEEVGSTLTTTNVTDDTQVYDTTSLTISAGGKSSFCIIDGTLYSSGDNSDGKLGLGNYTDVKVFTSTNVTDVKSVISCEDRTFIIKNDGTAWATGANNGRFGNGKDDSTNSFIDIEVGNVKSIACGYQHTMIIKKDGTLLGTGTNLNGQIGLGADILSSKVFVDTGMTNIKSVSAGLAMTAIIDSNGAVWGTGNGASVGLPSDTTVFTKTTMQEAEKVSCGDTFTMVIDKSNFVWGTGTNNAGQLGVGDTTNRTTFTNTSVLAESISATSTSTMIVKADGSLFGTGNNFNGQIGLGATVSVTSFTDTGANGNAVYCGEGHSVALNSGDNVITTGLNDVGQLGLNDFVQRTVFTNTLKTADSFVDENWTPFYQDDLVKIENYRYTVSLPTEESPSIFTSLAQIGYTNELKPFDNQNITPAISSSPMTYTIKGTEEFNAFTLAKVLATSITYTFKNDVGATIKTDTVAIDCKRDKDGILSLYPTTVTYYAGVQMPIDSTVEIKLTHSSDIELGDFTLNNMIDSGFTNLAFSHAIKDFNDYTPDAWGNIPESVKAIVTTFNVSMDVLLTNYDYAVSFNESIAGKNVTIDASDSDGAVADGETIFSSLIRRVRVNQPTMKSNVKDNSLGEFTTLTMKVQEIA